MDLKLKEKTDDESSVKKVQAPARTGRSIAELASLSTLSEEELEEANGEVEDGDTYDEYAESVSCARDPSVSAPRSLRRNKHALKWM